ncbi:MAG: hypothetical protein MR671_07165 [Clostridiales bacterium]|nr:hypothetical protein [Clostridiales bacterium]
MKLTEFEKKRAANLIWNGAGDYSVAPGFRVYDEEGRAELYWNSIVGSIHRHYDWEKLLTYYHTFHETADQGLYESLFWIAMENAAFGHEENERPVFPYLRREYARRVLKTSTPGLEISRADWIFRGHLHHAMGEDSGLPDLVDRKLLEAIEIGPELSTDEAIQAIGETLKTYFGFERKPGSGKERTGRGLRPVLPALRFGFLRGRNRNQTGPVRRLAFGYGEHVFEYGGEARDQSHLSVSFAKYTAQTDEGLKEYITNYFGASAIDEKERAKLEKTYCCGNHADVRLHLTRGDTTKEMLENGYAGKMRRQALLQAERNEEAFNENRALYRVQIERLASRIRNSVLMRMDAETLRSTAGRFCAGRVWRGLQLNDDLLFEKTLPGSEGDLTVDLLLDASTSQIHRQEIVAAQGYMIAEALTRCGIPVRVSSFCSLNGYLVMNLYRDYSETQKNRDIFRYVTTGANRDGLAFRLAAGLMRDGRAGHRILITLTDARPNDVIKVAASPGVFQDYAASVGVEDTAKEVHAARMQGISVMAVFTGDDQDLPSVRRIYGSSFARIRSLDLFADAVGTMLQTEISLI